MYSQYSIYYSFFVFLADLYELQAGNVCFGSRGSQFGKFDVKKSGKLIAVKLVHRSGKISCISSKDGLSNFGCGLFSILMPAISVADQPIFPETLSTVPWYKVPGYNSQSKEEPIQIL